MKLSKVVRQLPDPNIRTFGHMTCSLNSLKRLLRGKGDTGSLDFSSYDSQRAFILGGRETKILLLAVRNSPPGSSSSSAFFYL